MTTLSGSLFRSVIPFEKKEVIIAKMRVFNCMIGWLWFRRDEVL